MMAVRRQVTIAFPSDDFVPGSLVNTPTPVAISLGQASGLPLPAGSGGEGIIKNPSDAITGCTLRNPSSSTRALREIIPVPAGMLLSRVMAARVTGLWSLDAASVDASLCSLHLGAQELLSQTLTTNFYSGWKTEADTPVVTNLAGDALTFLACLLSMTPDAESNLFIVACQIWLDCEFRFFPYQS